MISAVSACWIAMLPDGALPERGEEAVAGL
jgi:hypothetical protein